jgi:hypothetical protein
MAFTHLNYAYFMKANQTGPLVLSMSKDAHRGLRRALAASPDQPPRASFNMQGRADICGKTVTYLNP